MESQQQLRQAKVFLRCCQEFGILHGSQLDVAWMAKQTANLSGFVAMVDHLPCHWLLADRAQTLLRVLHCLKLIGC
jgi:hypothetical protein